MSNYLDIIYEEDETYDEQTYLKHLYKFQKKFQEILELFHIKNINDYMKDKTYKTGNHIYDFIHDYPRDYVYYLPQKIVESIIHIYGFNRAIKRLHVFHEQIYGNDNHWEFGNNVKTQINIDRQIIVLIFKDECGLLF